MKIVVKDIISGGLDLHEKLTPEAIGFENRDDFTLLTPISADAHIEKVSGLIVARVNLKADYRTFCARCLEDLELKWKDHYIFDYPYKDGEQIIDLGEDIRQELILIIAPQILCKEDCLGICPECGANLNKEKCRCKK